jgi:uncharacterized protein (DUF362 family)/Pyruvate/2-oxoacid:ferredoxin oxidoreductase delta subunit
MNFMGNANIKICREHAHVSVVRCSNYDSARMMRAVQQAVDFLGGMGEFVQPGDRVLIKPNLLKAKPPEAAVTTHPEVVRAVIRLVHEQGGTAIVGDSPGMGDLRKVAAKCGILDVVHEEGARLEDLTEAVQVKNSGRFQHFEIARAAYEADVLINLPKLKTHGMTTLTGAVKNLFGCIPGKRKVQWHFNTGVNHELFMKMLLELYVLLKPRLTIMDAVVGMEGNGPGSGDPRSIGVLLAGRDAVSVDAVSARIVGVKAEKLPLLKAARSEGIGETDLGNIRLLGDPVENIAIRHFRLPPQEHLEWPLPEWARSSLKNAFTTRPVINHSRCIQCGVCQGHCPQGAIEEKGNQLEIRYRDCIRCFCCQEFCPQGAITVGKGWALTLLR